MERLSTYAPANFAGGVLSLMRKPFAPGNITQSRGRAGVVQAIHIFDTVLSTPQGDAVTLPNGARPNNILVNKTTGNRALVEIVLAVDGPTDPRRAACLAVALRGPGAGAAGPGHAEKEGGSTRLLPTAHPLFSREPRCATS